MEPRIYITASALGIAFIACILVGCRIDGHYVFPETHTVTVQLGGSGTGLISSDLEGLTCSEDTCSGEFFAGTALQLSASAVTGSFLGWTEACRGQGVCTVTMERDHIVGALFGTPGEALWLKQVGSGEFGAGRHIAIDNDGNVIAIGEFRGIAALGGPEGPEEPELTSEGESDIYVIKLSGMSGSVIWAKRFGGMLNDFTFSLAVDESNNIYVGGIFAGTVDFGSGPLTAAGPTATFVLKLDANGDFTWVRTIETNGTKALTARDNAVIIAGAYFGSLTIDSTTLMSVGEDDIFALKLDASTGAVLWIKSFGGSLLDIATDVILDNRGNAVLTGSFRGVVNYGGGTLSAGNGTDGYLLKLEGARGVHLLSTQFKAAAFAPTIGVDSADNIFVSGLFSESADFGCTDRLTTPSLTFGLFLVKMTQAGACVWAKGFELEPTNALALAVNNFGDVAATGAFCGSLSFGGDRLVSVNACDVFTARFDGDGRHLSSTRAGGTYRDEGFGIAQSPDGRIFVTGDFAGLAEFGGRALSTGGSYNAFIAAFPPR